MTERKVLFVSPSTKQSSEATRETEVAKTDEIGQYSPESALLVKKELVSVLLITIAIAAVFVGMLSIDRKSPWIQGFSEALAKQLIRGY